MDAKKFGMFIATLRKEKNMTQVDLAKKLKEARTKAALTQEQVAERILVSRQTSSNWESGGSLR